MEHNDGEQNFAEHSTPGRRSKIAAGLMTLASPGRIGQKLDLRWGGVVPIIRRGCRLSETIPPAQASMPDDGT